MPKTFVDGREVKKWYVDGRQVKKAYLDGRLIYESEFLLYITGSNHNVTDDWVWNHLHASGGGDAQKIKIIVNPGVELVSANTSVRAIFNFYGGWSGRVITIENHGYVIGRGGNGGNEGNGGGAGGRALYNESASVSVINHGVIAGGGGGGGANNPRDSAGGGGGAPFGAGGWGSYFGTAAAGSFTTGGNGGGKGGTRYGGDGGGWGLAGGNGIHFGSVVQYGGAAGEASRGAFNWIVLGDVRGARV